MLAVASLQSPVAPVWAEESQPAPNKFANGFPAGAEFFPIGVWLQHPRNAAAYSAAGVNTYVGLWNLPSENGLAQLERYGLFLIAEQTLDVRVTCPGIFGPLAT